MTLVFHHGALGDSVLIWPLLRGLAPATLIAPRSKARLAEHCLPGIRGIDGDSPAFSRLFAADAHREINDDVRVLLAQAERVVSFLSDGRDAWAANVAALAPKARRCFLRTRPEPGETVQIVEYHAGQLADQGWQPHTIQPERRINPGGPIVLHPGSGGREKCWPTDRFERLADHLIASGRRTILILGEAERERFDPTRLARWRREHEVHEPDDLVELADRIGRASLFIGNDSGPTHLAAQLGVKTLALFGPTDPGIWAPAGPAARILRPPSPSPMTWLTVRRVLTAAVNDQGLASA